MQEQMGNVSRGMRNLRKSQKERIEIFLKTVTKMKNTFDGLICGLDTAEKKEKTELEMYQ